jgi:hypothetical protein
MGNDHVHGRQLLLATDRDVDGIEVAWSDLIDLAALVIRLVMDVV